MSSYNNTPHELGWDDEISNDSSFILLEEGDYDFTVTAFERGRFQPGPNSKTPPCNKAILTLSVDTPAGTASVKVDLILYSTMEWKLAEFFRSIGQKKHGEPLRPRWNQVVGSRGRAHFKPRTYTRKEDGSERQANDVTKFYDFDEERAVTAPWGPSLTAEPSTTGPAVPQSGAAWKQESMGGMPTPTPWDSGRF